MKMVALTRAVPDSIQHCQLTHIAPVPIDIETARSQHAAYEDALRHLGCVVERVDPLPAMPDSVFVEDTAVVLDEMAVVTRPGAATRRGEVESMARALARYRTIVWIEEPATIDGGDVLRIGRRVFVGISTRTNVAAVSQLRALAGPHGYEVIPVTVGGVLHLKSAVTHAGGNHLLINPARIDTRPFRGFSFIEVDPSEPDAANTLLAGDTLLFPAAFPRTRARLESAGLRVVTLDCSELAKAEGALTCCSVLIPQ